jgi:hypothetical protein
MPENSATPNRFFEEEGTHGILDPVEPHHFLPEGLRRKRKGPLNPRTGRRPDIVALPGETAADIRK